MANLDIIRRRWAAAHKVEGLHNVLTLSDGSQVSGVYVLTESGACTPSHDALNGFAPSEGFPLDDNGGSVNDRDYFRDQDAQQVTREIARRYDGPCQSIVPAATATFVLGSNFHRQVPAVNASLGVL